MSATDDIAAGPPEVGRARLTRRRVLEIGLALLPAAAGARLLSDALGSPAAGAVLAASEPAGSTETGPGGSAAGAAYDPSAHRWGFLVDTTTCIGCGRCVDACKQENHVPDEPKLNRTWVELHLLANDGTVTIESPEGGRNGFPTEETIPAGAVAGLRDAYFVPRLCMQCDNPPCISVCPVSATYKVKDGVVLVDERRCIGCGYCMVTCPYGARYMVPASDRTPRGVAGVVDKCTFCYHRITRGQQPACVEVCPVQARVFGDMNDPASPVSVALREKRVRVIKPGLGTRPRVFYTGLEGEVE